MLLFNDLLNFKYYKYINISSLEKCEMQKLSHFFNRKNVFGLMSYSLNNLITLTWARGYKTFFMLNSAELEIYPAHKC